MKNLLFISMAIILAVSGHSQNHTVISKQMRDFSVKKAHPLNIDAGFNNPSAIPAAKSIGFVEETVIGGTRYDLQTNTSIQNRLHVYADGTIGATWTMAFDDGAGFSDRGTGYNYFDGFIWGPQPTNRIESLKTGWPSYAPWGENGELVVSHDFAAGDLYLITREQKGSGNWTETLVDGPEDQKISWTRTTTSGVDNSVIQMLAITWPIANGGTTYEDLNGAILYSRSSDGGVTWDPQHQIIEGMTADDYIGFSADDYEWAVSGENNIAFLVGDSWHDFFLMKSSDGGDNWEKTIIWENPYPFFDPENPIVTDTFYCVDGTHHLAFDSQGKVHVVFGINRAYSDGAQTYWFPGIGGIGYWNEDLPAFSNNLNALNPYDHPDSELIEDLTLIGWEQDIDGNGTIDVLDEWGTYYIGFSSQPQIVIDDLDLIYVVFSSVTEGYDNGLQNYRHLWGRGSWGTGTWGDFVQLTADLIHIFDECVFPSVAGFTDENFYLIYQTDTEPGLNIRGDLDPVTDNFTNFMKVARYELIPVGVEENRDDHLFAQVSQNYPNPFNGSSEVVVHLQKRATLSLTVTDLTGNAVYSIPEQNADPGINKLVIDAGNLAAGVYFYTVRADDFSTTKKLIVE
jgi:hypothetical protein